MADDSDQTSSTGGDILAQMLHLQQEATRTLSSAMGTTPALDWGKVANELQTKWREAGAGSLPDAAPWLSVAQSWLSGSPLAEAERQKALWEDSLAMFTAVLGQYGIGPMASVDGENGPELPRRDRRFSDPRWREQPLFALIHQSYLLLSEHLLAAVDSVPATDPARAEQLRFAAATFVDAISPSNFLATNPQALDRARETQGASLVAGMKHLISDVKRGQLTHTDPNAFKLGENIAATPGKVVYETDLYQLIQYTPTTAKVLEVPLVIFPPWINRFYILDLNPANSFVRWAVEQGITVFMVSWKSADATMGQIVWDDYIRAQIDAIDTVRARLKVPGVHTIGYCVAGTTLAATLAILARRGEADKVRSATFFTAQVDFGSAGDLRHFIDDQQLNTISALSPEGYLDGRYMAVTFNLLRGNDLIWNYVAKNYLRGEDYPAFDLLHWNGDVTNLPAKWHQDYLRDLYRDNRLVEPDSMSADGTPIDLSLVKTPSYIQAGREDHIAPSKSVWRMTQHLSGPLTFLLAGSGHIAGVVNPPSSGKYGYWTNNKRVSTLDDFIAGATEHKGSWWPHWAAWLRSQDGAEIKVGGKRKPGGRGDAAIEDAPGRYVMTR